MSEVADYMFNGMFLLFVALAFGLLIFSLFSHYSENYTYESVPAANLTGTIVDARLSDNVAEFSDANTYTNANANLDINSIIANYGFINGLIGYSYGLEADGNILLKDHLCNETYCYDLNEFALLDGGLFNQAGKLLKLDESGDLVFEDFNLTDGNLVVGGNILPDTDGTRDIGNSNYRWNEIYAVNGTIQTSDAKQKKNIKELSDEDEKILNLKSYEFEWKDKKIDNKKHYGFIAQEVKDEYDSNVYGVVVESADGELGIRTSEIIPLLTQRIKEQNAELEAIKTELCGLDNSYNFCG